MAVGLLMVGLMVWMCVSGFSNVNASNSFLYVVSRVIILVLVTVLIIVLQFMLRTFKKTEIISLKFLPSKP
jgi:hypothetical protein